MIYTRSRIFSCTFIGWSRYAVARLIRSRLFDAIFPSDIPNAADPMGVVGVWSLNFSLVGPTRPHDREITSTLGRAVRPRDLGLVKFSDKSVNESLSLY